MLKKQLLTAVLSTALIGSGVGSTFVNTDANIENTMDVNMDIQSHQARSIVGDWSGVLETEIMKVTLVLHIHQDSRGALSASFDTLEHKGTPIDEMTLDGRVLKFEIKRSFATFEGLLNNESTISGQFVLEDQSYSVAFERGIKFVEATNRPQEPRPPFPYTEEYVFYANQEAGVTLSGTLTLPVSKNPSPVVLLIAGSGPVDRDEALCPYRQLRYTNIGHKPFLVLADYLTRQGIAVLRLDKRGCGKSTGNYDKATTQDFASDVFAGVAYLKSRKEVSPNQIGLIGHSEGGIIAPTVAAGSKDVAFIVLMAAPAVNGEEIMYEQSRLAEQASGESEETITQDRNFQKELFTILKIEPDPQIAAGQLCEMAKNHRAALQGPRGKVNLNLLERCGQTTEWWRHFLLFDPSTALKQVKIPVLALTGELDQQASPTQNLPVISKALEKAGNNDFTIVELPRLNHFFQTCQDGSFGEYAKIEETIAPSVLNLIAEWILERTIENSDALFMPRTIEVVPYNSKWPQMFEAEAALIKIALGDNCIAVHHIGSTSIPGLSAKPIIDILPVVKDILKVEAKPMEALGYQAKGENGMAFRRYFQKGDDIRTHNVHVFEQCDPEIDRYLKFRDWMRSHPDDAKAYAALKSELATKFPNDILGYCNGKDVFVASIDKKDGYDGWHMVQALTDREWAAVRHLRQHYFFKSNPDPFTWTFDWKDHIHFVFYKNTDIIGYAHLQLWPHNRAALRIIVIDASYRNHGFGSQFLHLCERWLTHQGYNKLLVQASPTAYLFYSKLGYTEMPFDDPDGYPTDSKDTEMGKVITLKG